MYRADYEILRYSMPVSQYVTGALLILFIPYRCTAQCTALFNISYLQYK